MKINKEKVLLYVAEQGMTVKILAEKLGITVSALHLTFSKPKSNQPQTLKKLADVLGVRVRDLI
jgi:DNA-binding Xre family transcriptional regulator